MSDFDIEGTPAVIAALNEILLRQAAEARHRYESTGERTSFPQAPILCDINQHVQLAVDYASQTLPRSALPRTFVWCGITFRLIFPERGAVLIADAKTLEILNVGLPGWVDLGQTNAGDAQ